MSRPNLLPAGIALTIAAGGCVSYHPRSISPEASASALVARSLASAETRAVVRSMPSSWTLRTLTPVAWHYHGDIAVARAQLATARAGILTAGERPNPSISISPQIVTPLKWLEGTYGVDFDIPIETAGKRSARLAQANAKASSAVFHLASTQWDVRSRLRKSLLALFGAQQRKALLEKEVASQEGVIQFIERRVSEGEAARPESVQSRLLLNQLRLQLSDANRANAEAKAQVAAAIGMPSHAVETASISLAEFEHVPPVPGSSSLRRDALTHRPDVLGALADYTAAEAALRLEVARQYPDIHFGPGYQWDQGVNKWTVGLGFNIPILNQNRGPIAEATAMRTEVAAKFNALQAQVLAELERALVTYRAAVEKLAMAESLLGNTEKQRQSAEALLRAGESDRLAVVTAELERDAAALSRLDALVDAQAAYGAIEDAAQTPFNR